MKVLVENRLTDSPLALALSIPPASSSSLSHMRRRRRIKADAVAIVVRVEPTRRPYTGRICEGEADWQ